MIRSVFCCVALLGIGLPRLASAGERPNIVVIMADDLGYGDVSCNGAKALKTPNIDRLAAEGLRFTSGYSSASTCTPTRCSFLTGTYAFRIPRSGIAPPNAPAIIRPGTETVASLLKKAGYRTAVIGKWHLGLGDKAPDWNGELKPGPLELGFDHCLLLPTTNDRVPQVFVEDHRVRNLDPHDPLVLSNQRPSPNHPTGITHRHALKMDWSLGHNNSIHNGVGRIGFYTGGTRARFRDEDLADTWVKHSLDWIGQHREQPFFLFFAAHNIHVPRVVHERFQGKTTLGPRGDSIIELDWCVGELLNGLERMKFGDKTLVVFCSDNGPVLDDGYKDDAVEKLGDHKPAGPFRGGKYSVFEGGTRTPFLTWWKGRIEPGVSDQVVCTIDLAASLAALVGQPIAENACRDSQNVLDALLGKAGAQAREYLVEQDNSAANLGLRAGHWKLIRRGNDARTKFELYDLRNDSGETNNLAAAHPDVVHRLSEQLDRIVSERQSRK